MTMHTSNTRRKLLAKLHVLISQLGADKEALYSSYGVCSAKELSIEQLIDCTSRLEGAVPKKVEPSTWPCGDERVIRRMRSEVLCLMTRSPYASDPRNRGLGIPNDWAILNPWIKSRTGMLMPKMSIDELSAFRGQLLWMRAKGWDWNKRKNDEVGAREESKPEAQSKLDEKSRPKRKQPLCEHPILIDRTKQPS